ncbi:MAG: glutamate-1-semialdehyde 2,1-aminomutase, partial [Myxococcales bacterium]|nr:glutamate-1-semialdehyde 2,1-aminomutase [Myxococcales bacterium]
MADTSRRPRSAELFEAARKRLPGGVNSPVRAFRGVGGTPVFIDHAEGPYLHCVDGHRYIDYVGSWGPMILGHAHPTVVTAIEAAARRGSSFGAPTEAETELAELVATLMPSMEMMRCVSSGTEATLSAIRLARGATGRPRILKFSGCYHGHGDSLLADAGSGVATLGIPGTPGVLPEVASNTITVAYNDLAAVEAAFATHGDQLACVIVEPVAGNMGCIAPVPGFLELLRRETTRTGALLIFDEVMTGFRVALGGAQARYGVTPDITTLGKIVGGGMPVGVYGGRRDLLEQIAPSGPIYQAGTLSGNPVAMAAGLTTLRLLSEGGDALYDRMESAAARLVDGLVGLAAEVGIDACGESVGAMFGVFFAPGPVHSYADAKRADTALFGRWFHAMLDRGI